MRNGLLTCYKGHNQHHKMKKASEFLHQKATTPLQVKHYGHENQHENNQIFIHVPNHKVTLDDLSYASNCSIDHLTQC